MAMQHWKLERDAEGIAWATLDVAGSSTNTLGSAVMAELAGLLDELDRQPPTGLVIRSGKAAGFIAGADIEEFTRIDSPAAARALVERGWSLPVQMKFEIVPTTRPFGLMAPALFSGKVLLDGAPKPGCLVHIARMNTEKRGLPTAWHAVQVARTDDTGAFAFVCPLPGWWGFMAVAHGDPLKGPDGQLKPLEIGAVTWVYVDDPKANSFKPTRPKKN